MSTTTRTGIGAGAVGQVKTPDIYYAAYLKVAMVPYQGVRREEQNRVYFYFEKTDGIEDLRKQYYSREAKVPALTYADEVRAMKNELHSC